MTEPMGHDQERPQRAFRDATAESPLTGEQWPRPVAEGALPAPPWADSPAYGATATPTSAPGPEPAAGNSVEPIRLRRADAFDANAPVPHSPGVRPVQDPAIRRRRVGRAAGGGVAATAAAVKFWAVLKLLFGVLKLKTVLSALISVAVYAVFFGWPFAVGFVALMFVHELGHVYVLRRQGIPVTAPMFIPLLGAYVSYKERPTSVRQEAIGALAGPFIGMLGSVAVFGASLYLDSNLLKALAYTGFLLNLFNLIPALPFDGGRVAGALHPSIWLAGLAAVAVLLLFYPSPVLIIVLVLGGLETFRRWRDHRAGKDAAYHKLEGWQRIQIGVAYLAVIGACIGGMMASFVPRHF
jgi:Zn-dependent protease